MVCAAVGVPSLSNVFPVGPLGLAADVQSGVAVDAVTALQIRSQSSGRPAPLFWVTALPSSSNTPTSCTATAPYWYTSASTMVARTHITRRRRLAVGLKSRVIGFPHPFLNPCSVELARGGNITPASYERVRAAMDLPTRGTGTAHEASVPAPRKCPITGAMNEAVDTQFGQHL